MLPSLLDAPAIPQVPTDSLQQNIQVDRLAMQWTLDENAKLICQWVRVKN